MKIATRSGEDGRFNLTGRRQADNFAIDATGRPRCPSVLAIDTVERAPLLVAGKKVYAEGTTQAPRISWSETRAEFESTAVRTCGKRGGVTGAACRSAPLRRSGT